MNPSPSTPPSHRFLIKAGSLLFLAAGCHAFASSPYTPSVDHAKIGAQVPYTRYEAEDAAMAGAAALMGPNRNVGDLGGEASGRKAVKLINTGDSVEWTATKEANSIVIRSSIPDTADGLGQDATISIHVNGVKKDTVTVTSKYAWLYGPESDPKNTPALGTPRRIYDESHKLFNFTIAPGDRIAVKKDNGDAAAYYGFDFIELEKVAPPLPCPEGFVNLADEGITPANFESKIASLIQCFEWKAGYKEKKGIYIPPGRYKMAAQALINSGIAAGFEIRGAGMWYTELYDDSGAEGDWGKPGFNLNHKAVKFSDFAISGAGRTRTGSGKPFFNSYGDGSVMTRIWIEHMTCGFWVGGGSGVTNNLTIDNCRLRNLGADGINLCNGTKNSTVVNTTVRGSGDDGIAIWSAPEMDGPAGGISYAGCANNVVKNCTVELPWRANAYAIYGGQDNTIRDCIARDTLTYAGVNVSSTFNPRAFAGTTRVENMLIDRCGGKFWNGQEFGGLWVMAEDSPIAGLVFRNIDMIDATYSGIMLKSETYNKPVKAMTLALENVNVVDPGTCGIRIVDAMGSATFTNTKLINASVTPVVRIKDSNGKTGTGTIALTLDAISTGFDIVTLPAAPGNLSASALSETQIGLGWANNANNAVSNVVQRALHGTGVWTTVASNLPAHATTHVVDNLSPSTNYDFRVQSNNPAGSTASAIITIATPAGIGDGIPGWWRLLHFDNGLELTPLSAPDADPDSDSSTNAQEFASGTNPVSSDSVFRIRALSFSGQDTVLRFDSVSGKTYTVEKSTGLTAGGWTVVKDDIAGTGAPITITEPGGATVPKAFYRVRVR